MDISAQFERRACAPYHTTRTQYGAAEGELFPDEQEIRERLVAVARFYGNLIRVNRRALRGQRSHAGGRVVAKGAPDLANIYTPSTK